MQWFTRAQLADSLRRYGATLDALMAPPCIGCGLRAPGAGICSSCARELPWNRDACPRCAVPLAGTACLACLGDPPAWQGARSGFAYRYPVDNLVHEFKFGRRLGTGRVLARLTADWLASEAGARPTLLVPVPLHWRRRMARHFNPAREIAVVLSRRLGIAVAEPVRRIRATSPQSALTAAERRRNLRGAFEVTQPVAARQVAIVDDVLTTGATAAAMTGALREAGVRHVEVWTLARAIAGAAAE